MTSRRQRQPSPVRAIELKATFSAARDTLRKISETEPKLIVRGNRADFLIRGTDPIEIIKEARRITEIVRRATQASKDFK